MCIYIYILESSSALRAPLILFTLFDKHNPNSCLSSGIGTGQRKFIRQAMSIT